jgi:hypothetical protein
MSPILSVISQVIISNVNISIVIVSKDLACKDLNAITKYEFSEGLS